METIEINLRTLDDLENCEWNGKLNPSSVWIQAFNLPGNGIHFMDAEISLNLVSVAARMSNFDAIGRTFRISESDSLRKYDGEDGAMYFLRGLYLDGGKEPSYYLEFFLYSRGKKRPSRRDFKIDKRNLRIL